MFLFKCFSKSKHSTVDNDIKASSSIAGISPTKTSTTKSRSPSSSPKRKSAHIGSSDNIGSSTQPNDDNDDDESTLVQSVQDDPQFRNLYRQISHQPSIAEATSASASSRSNFTDSYSLPSYADASYHSHGGGGYNQAMMMIMPPQTNMLGQQTTYNPAAHNNNNNQNHYYAYGSNINNNNYDDDDSDVDNETLFLEGSDNNHTTMTSITTTRQYPSQRYQKEHYITFSVSLPSGKAGMVLDSPPPSSAEGRIAVANGGPMIYQIKENCTVADQVQVGDRLLSVDGQDCTYMSAMDASRLLGRKAHQPRRELLFARKTIVNSSNQSTRVAV